MKRLLLSLAATLAVACVTSDTIEPAGGGSGAGDADDTTGGLVLLHR